MNHRMIPTILLAFMAIGSLLPPGVCAAQDGAARVEFLFGLKQPELRTEEGAKALAQRVRARLRAAQLQEHKVEVVARNAEVRVSVQTSASMADLRTMLTSRGEVKLVPAVMDVNELKDIVPLLRGGVQLGQRQTALGELDLFLHSKKRGALEEAVKKLSFWNFDVVIGPLLGDDTRVEGFRTWMIQRGGPSLGSKALDGASVVSGTHPNYHFVALSWSQASDDGASALMSLTGKEGGALLLLVDGVLRHVVELGQGAQSGQMKVLLPAMSARDQLQRARLTAGILGSAAHPCEIVVLSSLRGD